MSSKKRSGVRPGSGSPDARNRPAVRTTGAQTASKPTLLADGRARLALLVVVLVLAAAVVIGADFVFGAMSNGSASTGSTATPAASSSQIGVVVQGIGGRWTNVTPDQLAGMMTHKDFALVNVKTPYIGEIDGTDLYIPYDQLNVRASALPSNKGARILVYCRSGAESAQAAQTLLDLGYTNVWNLDGGMNSWQASGRQIVQKNR